MNILKSERGQIRYEKWVLFQSGTVSAKLMHAELEAACHLQARDRHHAGWVAAFRQPQTLPLVREGSATAFHPH
jgi:hypothetical protein